MFQTEKNIIDIFEESFEMPFESKFIDRIDYFAIKRLSENLQNYYSKFGIPAKIKAELRPYIFNRFISAHALNQAFWAARDATKTPSISEEVNRYLLYSHSICFDDGLVYLLDYFRLSSSENEYTRSATPMVKKLLCQYAEISDLIRKNIVILISSEMFPIYNTPIINQDEAKEIRNAAFNWRQKMRLDPEILGGIVKEQLLLCDLTENNIDLYFPHKIYIPILVSIWRCFGQKYSSKTVLEPYRAGIICKLENIDINKISVKDIIAIRQEDTFEEFRGFIRRTLEKVDQSETFSDFESEFETQLSQELADNAERVKKLTKKSNMMKDIWSNADKVIIGAGVGGLPGAYAGSPWLTIAGAAAGAASKPILETLTASAKTSPSSNARASVRNHFLALQSRKG